MLRLLLTAAVIWFLSLPVHAQKKLQSPEKWKEGIVALTSGEQLKGRIHYDTEIVNLNRNYYVKNKKGREGEDIVLYRGRVLRKERLFFYDGDKVLIYYPEEIESFRVIGKQGTVTQEFTTLPYKYQEEEEALFFFEVLVDGDYSLIKRLSFIQRMGFYATYYLVNFDVSIQVCPSSKREVLAMLSGDDKQKASTRMIPASSEDEAQLVKFLGEYNKLSAEAETRYH
jgi:hypothetical protein